MSKELDCVQVIRDRYGKLHYYFRKKGYPRKSLPGKPGSREFMAEYMAAFGAAPIKPGVTSSARGGEGSIDWLVTSYLASHHFTEPAGAGGLSEETKAGRRRQLERFRAKNGSKSCLTVQPRHIQDLMDEIGEGGPGSLKAAHARRNWLKHISGLFNHAVDLRLRIDNPCKGFKRPKVAKSDGHWSWTDAEIAQYRKFWPLGTVQRLMPEIPLDLSARRTDTTRLGPGQVQGDNVIEFKHNKNGVQVAIPMSPRLMAAIEAMPATNHETFLHTKAGKRRSGKSLGGDFREWCDKAGLPKRCTMHGLRKACLRLSAEAGSEVLELQAIGGHKTLAELQKYIDAAKKSIAAKRGSARLEQHLKEVEATRVVPMRKAQKS